MITKDGRGPGRAYARPALHRVGLDRAKRFKIWPDPSQRAFVPGWVDPSCLTMILLNLVWFVCRVESCRTLSWFFQKNKAHCPRLRARARPCFFRVRVGLFYLSYRASGWPGPHPSLVHDNNFLAIYGSFGLGLRLIWCKTFLGKTILSFPIILRCIVWPEMKTNFL